ncbi:hypothetical protein ACRJ4W_02755 [Streptomyces sp. GLT-R25]
MAPHHRPDGRSGLTGPFPLYSPERDVQGSTWAQERDAQLESALARRAEGQKEQQDAR